MAGLVTGRSSTERWGWPTTVAAEQEIDRLQRRKLNPTGMGASASALQRRKGAAAVLGGCVHGGKSTMTARRAKSRIGWAWARALEFDTGLGNYSFGGAAVRIEDGVAMDAAERESTRVMRTGVAEMQVRPVWKLWGSMMRHRSGLVTAKVRQREL